MSDANDSPQPGFRVLSGNPSPEELAVVVAVLQAASATAAAHSAGVVLQPVSSWSRNAGLLRAPIATGFGQWRAAYRRGLTR